MTITVPLSKRWSSEQIAVLALTGTLVAVIIACVICISLSPAHIFFSIQDAHLQSAPDQKDPNITHTFFNFTLMANNTSRRMKVHFNALSAEIWFKPTRWTLFEANMSTLPWRRQLQPPLDVSNISVAADYSQRASATAPPPAETTKPGVAAPPPATMDTPISWPYYCKVVVVTKVHFIYGLARTRPFDIRVACFPVDFVHNTTYVACNLDD